MDGFTIEDTEVMSSISTFYVNFWKEDSTHYILFDY